MFYDKLNISDEKIEEIEVENVEEETVENNEEIVRFEPYNALSFEETKKSLEWRISSDEIFAIELKSLQNDWKRLSWETRM